VLLDYLLQGQVREPLDSQAPDLAEQLARARNEYHWYYTQLYGMGLAPGQGDDQFKPARNALRAAMRLSEQRIADLLEHMDIARAISSASTSDPPRSALDWLPSFGETIVLEYYLSPRRSVVFIRQRNELRVMPLSATPPRCGRLPL
jgi:hypothetical protein